MIDSFLPRLSDDSVRAMAETCDLTSDGRRGAQQEGREQLNILGGRRPDIRRSGLPQRSM